MFLMGRGEREMGGEREKERATRERDERNKKETKKNKGEHKTRKPSCNSKKGERLGLAAAFSLPPLRSAEGGQRRRRWRDPGEMI